ncbi:hypothetical protein COCNU_11G003490 [Cocos nucifera]|uniref:B box-type domain-containing protein n=1 Tax=Cocos nucifera TaxID=13894 RepID=A0A8K0INL4_COCNU|nr:hypothetical protein COCNU_11G003490 [Cocos nucifera]
MGEEKRSLRNLPCDYCGEAAAVLYCRADAARLCLPCDRDVHAANTLARKHIWDFNLGRSRDQDQSAALEIGYYTNSGGFMIKNYNDLPKENSFATTKLLEDIYDTNYPSANEDILSSNIHHVPSQNVRLIILTYIREL